MQVLLPVSMLLLLFLAGCQGTVMEELAEQPAREPDVLSNEVQGEDTHAGAETDAPTALKKDLVALSDLPLGCFGGKDCIPAIDQPKFVSIEEAKTFFPQETLVMGIAYAGEAKAYPLNILYWHEIVNDEIQGIPISVTFCPLCGTPLVFERTIKGNVDTLGVSGRLHNSCLVMYDRETETLFDQVGGIGVNGELAGTALQQFPAEVTTLLAWGQKYPDSVVLSTNTGYSRDYQEYPYGDYEQNRNILFSVAARDHRLHPKAVVYGITVGGKNKAYPLEDMAKVKILEEEFGGKKLLILYDRELGTIKIFDRVLNGQELHFVLKQRELYEVTTNSKFNFDGEGETRVYKGKQLEQLDFSRAFWFAWFAFHPETGVYLAE